MLQRMRLPLFRHATVLPMHGNPETGRRLQKRLLAQSIIVGAVSLVGGAVRELLIRLLVFFIVYDAISIVQRVVFHHGSTSFIGNKINHFLSNDGALLRKLDDGIDDSTGTIFFHNVQESDYRENRFYACAAYNSKLKEYKFKNVFNFRIKKTKRDKLNTVIPAAEQYVNQSSPVALVGEIHKLHCFFSGYPDPYPTWYHNGLEIIQNNTKGFTFENYGKTLVFNVTMDHMGRYECKFQTHASAVDRVFNVKVDAAPYWHDMPPANTNTSEGETVVFDCKTSGNPTPIVTFYKNGVEMRRPRQGENWVIDGSRLTIYDVKKGTNGDGDNAVYQCKSENKHGYLWTNFYLNLLAFEPKLLEEPDIAEAIEGKPFTTSCKFFASPLAKVTWKSPLLSGVAYRSSVDQFGAGWLIFEEVKESLEGEYNCVGTNKYGTAQGTVKLLVRKPTALAQFQSETMEWQAGVPLKLSCEAEHDPNLVISYEWKVNKKSIEDSGAVTSSYESEPVTMGGFGEAQHYRILKDNTLLIQNPTQHDSGSYVCTASTKLDSVSKKVFISVEDVPVPVFSAFILRCDTQANSATIQFEHLEPAIGTVPVKEFWVRYISDPEEESGKWRMHPASIRAIDYEVVNDAERRVKASITIPLRPFGSYLFQIVARNAIGDSAPQNVKGNCVTEQKPPTRNPNGVRVEGTQPDNLIVHWEAMPRDEWNGEKFAYQVLFRPKDEPGAEWQRVDVNDPFVERLAIDLGERRAWMPYEVQIRARNQLGDSLVTPEIVDGRTGEGDPGVTPSNFRVTDITATSAQFHWDAVDPSRVQGNFTGYKITYWYDEDEEIVDSADNGYTDGGPSTAAVQHVVMEAKSRRLRRQHHANARDASSSIVRRQRSTVSGGTTASGGGYDISSSSPALYRKTIVVAPDVTSAVVHSLRPNALNYATVTVMNGQNDGAKSDVVSFRTREGVPSPVRRLSAYPLNNRDAAERGLVVLRWEPPRVANGQLTHFGVRKCHTRDVAREVLECDEPSADRRLPLNITELRWDGLDYDATYRFQVYAYTNAGAGIPNSADARTLPEAMRLDVDPVRPSLVVDAIGEDHINVTFVPGHYDADKQAPVGNSFYVKYRETDGEPPATGTASSHTTVANNESTGDGDWKFQHADGDSLGMRVGGLTPGTRYQLAVIAMNRDNIGRVRESESRIHEVTTGGVSPRRAILYWILAAIALLLLLLLLLCLCCACARQRGEKYPVAEKERLHGRDTSHPKDRAFDEYGRPEDDEKRSLTGHSRAGESETDSMAEFGEGDPGRFTEDGSFIGQYGPNKTLVVTTTVPAPEAATATSGHHHYHHQSSQQSQQYWPSK